MKLKFLMLALCAAFLMTTVKAQDTKPAETRDDETNLETQLFLIVGTNQEVPDDKLPATLESVIKQLRATLPFKSYRLAATMINRVKNEGRLELSWIGGPMTLAA